LEWLRPDGGNFRKYKVAPRLGTEEVRRRLLARLGEALRTMKAGDFLQD
jgi:hypothetical protein